MRWHEITEASNRLTKEQACRLIADDDQLFSAVVSYVVNFESGLAENPEHCGKFASILSRVPKESTGHLWRGECRQSWRERFGRGFHSWSLNLDTALYFKRDCMNRDGLLLALYKPVRFLTLLDIITARMQLRPGESYYGGQQAEAFVYDPDAVRAAFEVSEDQAERIRNNQGMMRPLTEDVEPKIVPEIDEKKLAKAEADGFDISRLWYHGTRKTFASFRLPKRDGIDELGKGVYVTQYVGTANVWAQGSGFVLACVLRKGPLVELDDLPSGQHWHGGEKWQEVYRGYDIHMTNLFGPNSTPTYREFAERMNRREIKLSDCYSALGYIGATSRYSQIRGQAVIWDPKNVRIVGRAPGYDGYVSDPWD